MKHKVFGPNSLSEIIDAEKIRMKDEPWIIQTEYGQYKILAYEIEPVIEENGERVVIARNANHFVVATFTKVIYYEKMAQNIAQKAIQELKNNGVFFGRWIPASEGLPEESDYCLCCDKDGYMTIGYISKYSKEWCFDDDEVDMDVAAWIPLPEPYKAESEAAE